MAHRVVTLINSCLIGQREGLSTAPLQVTSFNTQRDILFWLLHPESAKPIESTGAQNSLFSNQESDFSVCKSPSPGGLLCELTVCHHLIGLLIYHTVCLTLFEMWLTVETAHPRRSSPRRISQRVLTSTSCWNMQRLRWEVETCVWRSCCPRVKT